MTVGGLHVLELGAVSATWTDLLRLFVAVPIFVWAAYRDVKIRRVPNAAWVPLAVLAVILLVADGWMAWQEGGFVRTHYAFQVAVSTCLVVPIAYVFWYFGAFGGADAKGLMAIALLFPTFPDLLTTGAFGLPYHIPPVRTPVGVFSFTVLTNAVLVGILYPAAVAGRNLVRGRFSWLMLVGRPVAWHEIPTIPGSLMETPRGRTRRGLDLDVLRMYLRWRGVSLSALRTDPERYRDPESLPDEPGDPGDGAIDGSIPTGDTSVESVDSDAISTADSNPDTDDPWGAEAFLEDAEGAYGMSPEDLREGLTVLVTRDKVWMTPGIPFMVPIAFGLIAALIYGDLLFGLLGLLGVV
ncbi:MAG: preflagellin peptidase FlaK [Halobacteriales archaeon]|jgi:preflagellin peptidase FlaK